MPIIRQGFITIFSIGPKCEVSKLQIIINSSREENNSIDDKAFCILLKKQSTLRFAEN